MTVKTAYHAQTIPESVTEIGAYAFQYCTGLKSINFPEKILSIGEFAFCGCSGLTSISMGEGITNIGEYAFLYCNSLQSITIPKSVTTIGIYSFGYCYNLKLIRFLGSAPTLGNNCFAEINTTAYYPDNDESWDEIILSSHGGAVTWKIYGDTSLRIKGINAGDIVYADGISYTVSSDGVIDVPMSTRALMKFTYIGTDSEDVHEQYPSSTQYYAISLDDDGNLIGSRIDDLSNALVYFGSSTSFLVRRWGYDGGRDLSCCAYNPT